MVLSRGLAARVEQRRLENEEKKRQLEESPLQPVLDGLEDIKKTMSSTNQRLGKVEKTVNTLKEGHEELANRVEKLEGAARPKK